MEKRSICNSSRVFKRYMKIGEVCIIAHSRRSFPFGPRVLQIIHAQNIRRLPGFWDASFEKSFQMRVSSLYSRKRPAGSLKTQKGEASFSAAASMKNLEHLSAVLVSKLFFYAVAHNALLWHASLYYGAQYFLFVKLEP